jgi:phosphopantothenoylcysteine decarboxylase/phosphopantothenate--cysteine ligase
MAHVLVCVGGSIAAYKACDLVSKLVQAGHRVDVAMTRAAQRFVRPLSFAALTHREVFTDRRWFEAEGSAAHLAATQEAGLVIVAPCTANLLARLAHGLADEIVSASVLGSRAPLLLAPAMNTRMWENPRVQANVATLKDDGAQLVGPGSGYLAEAEVGVGRMAEPAEILRAAEPLLAPGARPRG